MCWGFTRISVLSGPFVVSNRGQQSPNSMVAKMDHQISASDSLSGRFLYANGEDEFPGGGPGPGGGSQLGPWFGVTPTMSPTLLSAKCTFLRRE